jgi:hypothetical protein
MSVFATSIFVFPSIADALAGVKCAGSPECTLKRDEAIGGVSATWDEEIGLTPVAGTARIRRVVLIRPET